MVAELSALMPSTTVLSKSFNALMALDSVAIPTAARMAAIASRTASYNNTAAAAAGTHAGILECSLLSLVVQLLLPAVQVVLADGATGQGGGSTAGFAEQFITRSVHILMRCAVSEGKLTPHCYRHNISLGAAYQEWCPTALQFNRHDGY
jgi:hypothetical protein